MPGKTPAQKKAQKAYMEKFIRLEIRVSPERRDAIQAAAIAQNKSLNVFINDAIDEALSSFANVSSADPPQD